MVPVQGIEMQKVSDGHERPDAGDVPAPDLRADARRNAETILKAAGEIFLTEGVDAPIRRIASAAGVGVGTIYRRFPKRSDLIAAVFRQEIEDCAEAAFRIAGSDDPLDTLLRWMDIYVGLIETKRGLAEVLHSGDDAYAALPEFFNQRLVPALESLLKPAIDAGHIRSDVDAEDIISGVARLCMAHPGETSPDRSKRLVALLLDGLRLGHTASG